MQRMGRMLPVSYKVHANHVLKVIQTICNCPPGPFEGFVRGKIGKETDPYTRLSGPGPSRPARQEAVRNRSRGQRSVRKQKKV